LAVQLIRLIRTPTHVRSSDTCTATATIILGNRRQRLPLLTTSTLPGRLKAPAARPRLPRLSTSQTNETFPGFGFRSSQAAFRRQRARRAKRFSRLLLHKRIFPWKRGLGFSPYPRVALRNQGHLGGLATMIKNGVTGLGALSVWQTPKRTLNGSKPSRFIKNWSKSAWLWKSGGARTR
jgi:hypothetical protein